jgi:diguanylate cyclase (GGDEF)-like protein
MQLQKIKITPKEYEKILDIQANILQKLSLNNDYDDTLQHLCLLTEALLPNAVATIMLVDKDTGLMNVLSAPSIPEAGKKALQNLKPGPGGGSCGNAIFHQEAQYVLNTFKDDRWVDLRQVAFDYNLCSCWSMPIKNENNESIGTFALSSFEHRLPAPFHKKLLETAAFIVNIVLKNKSIEERIHKMIYYDALTGLFNKTHLDETLKEDADKTLLILDINNFSYINSTYGFEIGDKILIKIAKIFKNNLIFHKVCRLGSDEFAIVFTGKINIVDTVNEIKEYFYQNEFHIDKITLNISFTYGAAFGEKDIYKDAVIALKEAKNIGKNSLHIFNKEEESISFKQRKSFIEANTILHHALHDDTLVPYFQGIRDNKTGTITKFEVLARIEKNGKVISPYRFLEPARLSGLLPEITKIIIDKSFKAMKNNDFTFSLNLTEDDLARHYVVDYLDEKTKEHGINPKRVIIEILEGVSASGKKNHIIQLRALKERGYAIAIDDFGTEYSNFERLLDLEIDFLKIDAKYIKDIDTNPKSYEITKAIVYFAKNAHIPCIAEFVHSKEVQEIMLDLEIEFSQGYFFSEPSSLPVSC